MLTISKKVPARTRIETADWCVRDFMLMSPDFRRIRRNHINPIDKCYWCKHPFADGEMMSLAHFTGKPNKTLCQSCADELLGSQRIDE